MSVAQALVQYTRMAVDGKLAEIPTPLLKAIRDLCPTKNGDLSGITVTLGGMDSKGPHAEMTPELREKLTAELKRRKAAK